MSRFTPKPAVRTGQRARIAIAGPSGAGKTWDALLLAEVFGGKVLVLDTERGSSALYSDRFSFDVIEWTPPFDPRELADEIRARAGDYDVLVIDSLSHFWEGEGGTRDIVDAAAARAKGNSFAGWKEGTPAQDAMVQAILSAPCHVIGTMRSKTDYVLEERNGKQVPRKVGMAPIQRAGMEYEFTVTCEVDRDHILVVDKSRCVELSDAVFPPNKVTDMGDTLMRWLAENEPAPTDAPLASAETHTKIRKDIASLPKDAQQQLAAWWQENALPPISQADRLTEPQADAVLVHLVACTQDPSGETPSPVSPDALPPAPPPSTDEVDGAAGADTQHSTAASVPAASLTSQVVERLRLRLNTLPDETRAAVQGVITATWGSLELVPEAEARDVSRLLGDAEKAAKTASGLASRAAGHANRESAA